MQITIGCVDGNSYSSEYHPDEEVMKEVEANGGYVHDILSDKEVPVRTIEELKAHIESWLNYRDDLNRQTITLYNKIQGDKTFNVKHIVWFSVTTGEVDIFAPPF